MALRSIPTLLHYCELIRRYANPNVMVFNFTNPAGLVTQALRDQGYSFVHEFVMLRLVFCVRLQDYTKQKLRIFKCIL